MHKINIIFILLLAIVGLIHSQAQSTNTKVKEKFCIAVANSFLCTHEITFPYNEVYFVHIDPLGNLNDGIANVTIHLYFDSRNADIIPIKIEIEKINYRECFNVYNVLLHEENEQLFHLVEKKFKEMFLGRIFNIEVPDVELEPPVEATNSLYAEAFDRIIHNGITYQFFVKFKNVN